MSIQTDIQTLTPGNLLVFFELDATLIGGGQLFFHGNAGSGPLIWKGQSYSPWAIKAEGFARTSDQQPTPKLAVGNVDGSISLLCIAFEDMVGTKIVRRRTFAKYLDAVNFPGGNTSADPNEEFPAETWYIERKSVETREFVEFELASALDFNGVKLPRRQIVQNHCPFVYRGAGCGYTGPAVADALDTPTSNPALDVCGKRLQSCKLRQWPNNILNFGGFPAAGLVRV